MKRFLLILICTCASLLCFTSCEEVTADANDAIPYEQKSDKYFEDCISLKWYKGHRYVVYHNGHREGIAHDPDCPRCEEKKKAEEQMKSDSPQNEELNYEYDYSSVY